MSSAGNLETFLETQNLRWLGSTGGLKAGQGDDTKDLLDLEAHDGASCDLLDLEATDVASSGDLLDLEAPALANNLVVLDVLDESSDDDDDEEDDDYGTDGEEEMEVRLFNSDGSYRRTIVLLLT